MTRKIWKHAFPPQQEFSLELPVGYEIVHIGHQHNKPTMWVMVDPAAPKTRVWFHALVTGQKFLVGAQYLGTFVLYKGDYVGHLFAGKASAGDAGEPPRD